MTMDLMNKRMNADIMLDSFLDATGECVIFVDQNGYIEVLSKAYAEFLQVDQQEAIGKHVTEVIENTRMHIVLATGQPELTQPQEIRGVKMIASRIPIFRNGEVVGAFGRVLFKDFHEVQDLYDKLTSMEEELSLYKSSLMEQHRTLFTIDDIITKDPGMHTLKEQIVRAARTSSNVLILGESGTGKELFAHAIHQCSRRNQYPFVSLNCGSIPSELLETELFGYTAGAFTGANPDGKIGLIQVADKGTFFLDEVAELPIGLQVKLLRFLQSREIKRLGSTTMEQADVRIIAATNKNLMEMVGRGAFREDLYYRLNVVAFQIPPLRKRPADIPLLAGFLAGKIGKREGIRDIEISDESIRCLKRYDWPGNVRELENMLENAINFMQADRIIRKEQLPPRLVRAGRDAEGEDFMKGSDQSLKSAMESFEKALIRNMLNSHGYNKSKVASILGVSRTTLYDKLDRYDIQNPRRL